MPQKRDSKRRHGAWARLPFGWMDGWKCLHNHVLLVAVSSSIVRSREPFFPPAPAKLRGGNSSGRGDNCWCNCSTRKIRRNSAACRRKLGTKHCCLTARSIWASELISRRWAWPGNRSTSCQDWNNFLLHVHDLAVLLCGFWTRILADDERWPRR